MKIDFSSNLKDFQRSLDKTAKKQLPFATAVALTRTAQNIQAFIIDKIPSIFNTTKKWWLKTQPTGIKISRATKKSLVATVFTRAFFAKLQEYGGLKTPTRGKNLAIPTVHTPKSRRKAGGASIVARQKTTFTTSKGIFRKTGPKKNPIIKKIFTFSRSAKIKPRFNFRKMAEFEGRRTFFKELDKSFKKAMKSRRR